MKDGKEWLVPSGLQMKNILEGIPKELSYFNLNYYFDDILFLISLLDKYNPLLIEIIKDIDSKSISNVWSLLDTLTEIDKAKKGYSGLDRDIRNLAAQVRNPNQFYADSRRELTDEWREIFARTSGTKYPEDFVKIMRYQRKDTHEKTYTE